MHAPPFYKLLGSCLTYYPIILPALAMARLLLLVICTIGAVLELARTGAEANVFTVGDASGWDVSADLALWLVNKTFHVGDTLLFQYSSYHTFNEVDRGGYENCSNASSLLTSGTGNTSVPLAAPGRRYFVSGAKLYCLGGMKLQVNVVTQDGKSLPPADAPRSPTLNTTPSSASSNGRGHLLAHSWSSVLVWLCIFGALDVALIGLML